MEQDSRVDGEWVTVNAVRELLKLATKGDPGKSTYDNALEVGGELYPELLGPESSLLRRDRESDTTKEFRQRARLRTLRDGSPVHPRELVVAEISEIEGLLQIASLSKADRGRVDQLKRRLALLRASKEELSPEAHTENQLIFRDAYNVQRNLPSIGSGKGSRDFQLPDANVLRVRVLHPDRPEHVTGADIIYERHAPYDARASFVAIQYKIWTDKTLLLSDSRMQGQLRRLQAFACASGLCNEDEAARTYRFPYCVAFLRPTDKLQRTDQKLLSTGEHLPLCQIERCSVKGARGASALNYESIREASLSSDVFESLFTAGKIGSRMFSYEELASLYESYEIEASKDRVVIHAQEFNDGWQVD